MRKLILMMTAILAMSTAVQAEDHVMAATKGSQIYKDGAPKTLSLSLKEAQDYAVKQNRTLKNASLAVQEAYAARWQTIASMLPQVDGSYGYSNMFGYKLNLGTPMPMANTGTLNVTASVGLNGQAIVGALLNNVAIDMKKIALEQSESELRSSILSSYVSVLALRSISNLLDSSLNNIEHLETITRNAVEAGAAEQTTADQIHVRVNTLKNSINVQKRNIELATNSLKVLLDVPAETELTLTESIDEVLSPERVMNLLGENFAVENNLNYQLLAKQVELAKRNVHMASWAYGPTVGVGYQYSDVHKFTNGFGGMAMPHVLQVSVKMPIWSSGKRAAGIVEKKIALEEAKNTLSETTDNLEIQYRQLCFNLSSAYETYINEKENIEVTQRVFHSTTEKFKWGAASNLELTNASNDLISAQSTYVQAMLELINAQSELEEFLNK